MTREEVISNVIEKEFEALTIIFSMRAGLFAVMQTASGRRNVVDGGSISRMVRRQMSSSEFNSPVRMIGLKFQPLPNKGKVRFSLRSRHSIP